MAKTILIVDDSRSLREVVSITLKGAGYDVIEASDGKEGLSRLDGRKIHLIISDVNMPGVDGFSMVKEIRSNPIYKFTPIIMLTTEFGDDMKQHGKDLGVKAWVVKPFRSETMLAAVSKLILP